MAKLRFAVPLTCVTLVLGWGTAQSARPQERQHEHHPQTAPTQTRPAGEFQVPDHSFADVDRWVGVFDDPARDEWQQPAEVVAALELTPGAVVADLGAGTGYFAVHLARAVGPQGKVLAIDLEPNMVEHLRSRMAEAGLSQVEAVLATPDDPRIPAGSADTVLLVDTYHHIHQRVAYLRRLQAALKPGGEVVVVDFHKRPLPVGPPLEHKMAREEVVDEFVAAGYVLQREEDFLPHQYFLFFAPGAAD